MQTGKKLSLLLEKALSDNAPKTKIHPQLLIQMEGEAMLWRPQKRNGVSGGEYYMGFNIHIKHVEAIKCLQTAYHSVWSPSLLKPWRYFEKKKWNSVFSLNVDKWMNLCQAGCAVQRQCCQSYLDMFSLAEGEAVGGKWDNAEFPTFDVGIGLKSTLGEVGQQYSYRLSVGLPHLF